MKIYLSSNLTSSSSLHHKYLKFFPINMNSTTYSYTIEVKVIFVVVKQLKQLQKNPRKKNPMLQWDLNPWPPQHQCDALPTELWCLVGSRSRAIMIYIICASSYSYTIGHAFQFLAAMWPQKKKNSLHFIVVIWLDTRRNFFCQFIVYDRFKPV